MKKKFRVIPLATAAFLALGMSAASAETIYFANDKEAKTFTKADADQLKLKADLKAKYREAQNKGWKIFIESDDSSKTIDWSQALGNSSYKSYTEAAAGMPNTSKPIADKITVELDKNGNVTEKPAQGVVESVEFTSSPTEIAVGSTLQLTAVAKDKNGTVLTGKTVTWSASPATIAEVDQTGKITAKAEGSVTITATVEGKSKAITLTVKKGETPVSPTVSVTGLEYGALGELDPSARLVSIKVTGIQANATVKLFGETVTLDANGEAKNVPVTLPDELVDKTDAEIKAAIADLTKKYVQISTPVVKSANVTNLEYGALGELDPSARLVSIKVTGASSNQVKLFGENVTLDANGEAKNVPVTLPDELVDKTDAEIKAAIADLTKGYLQIN